MPYYRYAGMADRDVADLVAYLRTLPAIRRASPPADVLVPRVAYRLWRWLFVSAAVAPPEAPVSEVERGRYLVEHVSVCGDCHTPRNRFGVPDERFHLAGTDRGPDGKPVPNITPDKKTGSGDFDDADLVQVLSTGMLPDFDNVQGLMAEMVDGYGGGPGYGKAPATDLRAIAAYLKTVPAIVHEVRKPGTEG